MMKKRLICCTVVLLLCLSIGGMALARQAKGSCAMSKSGRSVSFSGNSNSAQTEDSIGVLVQLMEKRGTTWYEVARASNSAKNTDYVSTSDSKTVTGGYYYKVIGTHTSAKGGASYSGSSETPEVWIP